MPLQVYANKTTTGQTLIAPFGQRGSFGSFGSFGLNSTHKDPNPNCKIMFGQCSLGKKVTSSAFLKYLKSEN